MYKTKNEMNPFDYYQKEFYELICANIKPRNISDKTCFKRIAGYLAYLIMKNDITKKEAISRVTDYLYESNHPNARKPAAVFVYIMKKEFNYDSSKMRNITAHG